jgi:hypothetical protein
MLSNNYLSTPGVEKPASRRMASRGSSRHLEFYVVKIGVATVDAGFIAQRPSSLHSRPYIGVETLVVGTIDVGTTGIGLLLLLLLFMSMR